MKGITTTTTRQLKIETAKIIPLTTELVPKQKALIRAPDDTFIEVKNISRDLKRFLELNGFVIENSASESRRGKTELAGVPVKIMPVMHTHYDGGVFIRIIEKNEMSADNTNKVIKYLQAHGIDINKECVFVSENTEEGACLFKRE